MVWGCKIHIDYSENTRKIMMPLFNDSEGPKRLIQRESVFTVTICHCCVTGIRSPQQRKLSLVISRSHDILP